MAGTEGSTINGTRGGAAGDTTLTSLPSGGTLGSIRYSDTDRSTDIIRSTTTIITIILSTGRTIIMDLTGITEAGTRQATVQGREEEVRLPFRQPLHPTAGTPSALETAIRHPLPALPYRE